MSASKPRGCRSCPAWIFWVTTAAGKKMPLDAEPHPEGTVWLDDEEIAHLGGEAPAGRARYRAHFATCPASKKWRGSSREAQR